MFRWFHNVNGRVYFFVKATEEQAQTVKKEWASLSRGAFTRMGVNGTVVYISFPLVKGGASKEQKKQRQLILKRIWKTMKN